ncbi:hypothetical protein C8J55DRAFT_447914 [Lentinula edodes]|uniref:Uncharacterized protein n=1 Tax=Lentinula lateritia TaxID=40482 RepID=A0A9W9E0F3_9AGAR|nr:hypothetical protein C8J55DRAFT_447914 [Lentinula edodes]
MPIYSFQKGVGVESIPLQVHPYAKKMMTARKYVPLWYFLPDAVTKAKDRSKDSLVGSHTVRASPNAIPDSRLSWPQVMRAKSAFLNTLRLGAWPDDHISMFAAFYINMDMHSELQEQDGDQVMAHYHAEMRLAWYDAMERKEPFDLSVISNRVLAESRREIVKQRQEKTLKDIQAATALMEARVDAKLQKLSQITSTPPFPSPRQSSGKARQTPYPSTSPRKASRQPDNPNFQRSFRDLNQAPLTRCHRCLGRDRHDVRHCSRTSLWNRKRGVTCKWNKQGFLEITSGTNAGLELCADWQRRNGCTSKAHPEKHRCSGCTSSSHGASSCPEGE